MFAPLVDPAGLAETETRGRTAALMEDAASRPGHAAGAKMPSVLDIFADVADIAGRTVDDGAMGPAVTACRGMTMLPCDAAEACRAGGGGGGGPSRRATRGARA